MPTRKMPVVWSTGIGGAGVSVFYSPFGVDMTTELATFFNAIKSNFPAGITIACDNAGDKIDDASGELTGSWTDGTSWTLGGGSGSFWPAGAGGRVVWKTSGVNRGRRIRGTTFLVPLTVGSYETDGSLLSTSISTMANAATAYFDTSILTNCAPSVWSRTHGIQADITGRTVPDRVAVLRSRRD